MPTTTTPEIVKLYANLPADQVYIEDIYDNLDDAIRHHPDQQIIVGYCIIDKNTNKMHENSKDWYDTYNQAEEELNKIKNKIKNANNETPELYALQPCDNNAIVRHVRIRALNAIDKHQLKELVSNMLDFYCDDRGLSKKWRKNVTWDDAIDIAVRYPRLCHDFGFEVILENDENKINLNEPVSE